MKKAFISSDNTITFECPKCNKPRTVDVSNYKNLEKAERVKIKCTCGNTYYALIEKRKQFRKKIQREAQRAQAAQDRARKAIEDAAAAAEEARLAEEELKKAQESPLNFINK